MQFDSLAKPSWAMSHYNMLYEYGRRTRDFFEAFLFIFLSLVCYIFGAFLTKQLFHSPLLDMR